VLSVTGLVIAGLGWIMFIPADPYYTPSVYGFTNRVNSLAGFGLVMALYGALGIVGAMVGRAWRNSAAVAAIVPLCLGVAVGVTYMRVLSRHAKIWNAAFRAELTGIDQMRKQLPDPRSGTTVFTSGYPANQTLGVPIF